jgi:ubiquitin-conjugating enzyme E2 J2
MNPNASNVTAPTGATLIQKKRFTNELKLLNAQPLGYITAYPDETNPLIWYFLLVGQKGTQYYGGHYIGEIKHSPKYPAEPPDYYMRTPSGRYEINSKICLTNSGYHKGDWSSTWNIQSILIAYYSIWLDDTEHGISHIKRSAEERAKLAKESKDYNIKNYKKIYEKFDFSTLTDDIDNAPKPKTVVEPVQTTQQVVNEPTQIPQQVINEPTQIPQQVINEPTQIPQQVVNEPTQIPQQVVNEPVQTTIDNNKFKEIYDNINKINEQIDTQGNKIEELENYIKKISK